MSTLHVIALAGISGSGKSHFAQGIVDDPKLRTVVFSADDYMIDAEGNYFWDPRRIPECHNLCLKGFTRTITTGMYTDKSGATFPVDCVIVDNTNTKLQDLSPYCALALAFGHKLKVIAFRCDPEMAHKRTRHNTPLRYIVRQARGLDKVIDKAPASWNLEAVPAWKSPSHPGFGF